MAEKNRQIAEAVVKAVGGTANITSVTHCMTRLRFVLKDKSIPNKKEVDKEFVKQIIHNLGLERKLKNMPNNLSGGQQQRVAIARALATKPAIILADEPTGNLDSKTSIDVILLMQSISREFNQTILMITHNEEIAQMADRIIRIEDGKVV